MKKLLLIFVLGFFTATLYSQQTNLPKKEKKGDLTEITLYYDNGEIMQHGFYNELGELHGGWESYYMDGARKCVAFYDKGVKVGTWSFWNNGIQTNVVYVNNKIIGVEKIDPDSSNKKIRQ